MSLLPSFAADTAAAAAAHLWHLTYQLGGNPSHPRPGGALDRWRELACELTMLSEQLRAGAAGRRQVPFDDGRTAHVVALRSAILEVLERYQGSPANPPAERGRISHEVDRCGLFQRRG